MAANGPRVERVRAAVAHRARDGLAARRAHAVLQGMLPHAHPTRKEEMGARASLEAGCTRDMRNAWSAGPSGHPASSPDASALSITNRPRSTSRSLVAGAKVVAVLARAAGAAAQAARAQRLLLLLLLALLPLCVRPKVERCNSMVRKLGANGCGRERRALGRGRGCGDGARVRARYCASSRALSCLLYCQLVRSIRKHTLNLRPCKQLPRQCLGLKLPERLRPGAPGCWPRTAHPG